MRVVAHVNLLLSGFVGGDERESVDDDRFL